MADEVMIEPTDVPREAREMAAAWAKYYSNRTPENLQAAIKESGDVYRAGKASGWTWKQIGMAVVAAVVAVLLGVGGVSMTRQTPAPPIKDNHDVAKLISDGFAGLIKYQGSIDTALGNIFKKLDAKPEPLPLPVDPEKPKPNPLKPLTLPKEIETSVGGKLVKVKAVSVGVVTWIVPPGGGLDVHTAGDTAILAALADGEYWLGALTVVGGKATEPEWCRIVCGKGPQPPPGPKPPVPPTPKDWPTTAPGLRVLIIFEEMERHLYSPGQRAIINGAPIRDHLDSVCVSDGQWKSWRIWDKDVGLSSAEPHWKAMMGRPRVSVPWVVISNYPKAYYEGPLPASVDDFKTQIQKVQ